MLGAVRVGAPGTFTVTVRNTGTTASSGVVQVDLSGYDAGYNGNFDRRRAPDGPAHQHLHPPGSGPGAGSPARHHASPHHSAADQTRPLSRSGSPTLRLHPDQQPDHHTTPVVANEPPT